METESREELMTSTITTMVVTNLSVSRTLACSILLYKESVLQLKLVVMSGRLLIQKALTKWVATSWVELRLELVASAV